MSREHRSDRALGHALVFDIAVYHLTGAGADIPAALSAFRRAAGPLLERTRTA